MPTVYLGLGSNLGDREANLRAALEAMPALGVSVTGVSPFYETEPVGYLEQERFLNAACSGETSLAPLALLRALKELEAAMGRLPAPRNMPRVIDIDILLYEDLLLATPELEIPHPRMAERAFVLAPLADIAAGVVHPGLGKSVRQLRDAAPGREGVRLWLGQGVSRTRGSWDGDELEDENRPGS
jgi:2-amino-4-hydroxy-6-hydroxymethyldihydropteridine diphosphokinase